MPKPAPAKKTAATPKKGKLSLQETLVALRNDDASLRVGSLSDFDMNVTPFTTGNISLDNAIGVGGFPRGKVIELFGISQSGKTTSALQAAASHQAKVKSGEDTGAILYLDYEYSLDQDYCTALGLDVDDKETFLYFQPTSLEQGCNLFRNLMSSGFLAMAIFDSVAAMVTQKEQDADTGTSTVADRAKMLTQFLRQVKGECWRQQTSIIFLNHVLEAIDTNRLPGRPPRKYTPGGNGLVFYSDVRVEYQQIGSQTANVKNRIENEVEKLQVSTTVQAKVVKNKVAVPQKIARMRVRYGKGFSQHHAVYQILVAYKKIKTATSWVTVPADILGIEEDLKVQGEEKVISLFESDPEIFAAALDAAQKLVADYKPGQDTDDFDIDPDIDPDTGEVSSTHPFALKEN